MQGLKQAVAAGKLDPAEAAGYRAVVRQASRELKTLPPQRAENLAGVLSDVAAQRDGYTKPRALTLFTMLAENASYLAAHALPASGKDIFGQDGVLYRFFPGHGFAFHPLGNFALLNNTLSAGNVVGAQALADALVQRAIPDGSIYRWEYYFPFADGTPPWTSGMAQAVAAQAFARLADRVSDPALVGVADAAFRAIPGRLVQQLDAGPWIKLYSFQTTVVLNAQLQAVVSLRDYAEISGTPRALVLAARLRGSAEALLPSFDTGAWSLYSLHGSESPLAYHEFVIALLKKLALRFGDSPWRVYADRFALDELQPPLVHPGRPLQPIYPAPQDGYKDEAAFPFYVSKLSTVTLHVDGDTVTGSFSRGFKAITWSPGPRAPGLYHPLLVVVDQNGHRVEQALPPLEIRNDTEPPAVSATVAAPAILTWHAVDPGTPWLSLTVRLAGRGKQHVLKIGTVGLNGARHLELPPGRWHAALLAANSAGKVSRISLGILPVSP
jgi:hypothetical protein